MISDIQSDIQLAAQKLMQGEVICYPTETLWGLGCLALNKSAVSEVFELKDRDKKKPLSVLVRDVDMAATFVHIDASLKKFLQLLWPGPFTFIIPKKNHLLNHIIGEEEAIGVRQSPHEVLAQLFLKIDQPLITTSANESGKPSALTEKDLAWLPENLFKLRHLAQMSGKASWVLKVEGKNLTILRSGSELNQGVLNQAALLMDYQIL